MKTAILSIFTVFACTPILHAEDWSGWRGADRTAVSTETGLLKQWPSGGPKRIWLSKEAGLGYSSFSVVGGKLFTMGAFGDKEHLLAFDANTGKSLWKNEVGNLLKNNWGDGPRSCPTVANGLIYVLGGSGDLACVDPKTGKTAWSVSLTRDLGGKVPGWGYTESVLVDQGRVICTPGGKGGALAALDAKTGKTLWRSKAFTDGAQYSSPIVIEHGGVRQYVQLVMKNFVGVKADDGALVWKSAWPGRTAVIPTPIHHEGHVYVTSGYGVGCKLVQLGSGGAKNVYDNKNMKNHHGGVIKLGDHLYGYSDGYGWVCQDFKTGDIKWNEKKGLGKGAISYADERFYCQAEGDGSIALIEASPQGWKEHGRFKLDPQTKQRSKRGKIWTHPVIANGRLYLRDQELLFCFDVKK
ncbi:MAG: PQQ-binding-like beta-propeller repeat protein [Opitutales bacterium]